MEPNAIELMDKDGKGEDEHLIGNVGDLDQSEVRIKKIKRILIIISVLLAVTIIDLIVYFIFSKNSEEECKKGENENCLSCEKGSKKCGSCNPNFRLENGKCLFIFSFEGIYNTSQKNDGNEGTKLFNVESLANYKINKIQVDDKYAKNNTNYIKFDEDGLHKVRINIDLKNSSSLNKFFENINDLISINFTNDFNITGIENMDEMFSSS